MALLFLILTTLLSYGQTLGMGVWQDDNGLFFKLAHVSENAGYLSAGPFGGGAYKYIHTPYIPIHYLFGFNTPIYFAVSIIFYILTTIVVFKIFANILGEKGGRMAGFLYAAGYIASDGFIRLFNTVVTSVSVITVSLLTLSYWKFFKTKKLLWYLSAILFYFLSIELARGRTHYLIGCIFAFELVFFRFKKQLLKNFILVLVRLLPFIYIFHYYFIKNSDHRSANVGTFLNSLLHGDLYQLYGFLSSISNLFIPDWFTSWLFKIVGTRGLWLLSSVIALLFLLLLYKKLNKKIFLFLMPLVVVWSYLARSLFSVPQINPSDAQITLPFVGSVVIIFLFSCWFLIKKEYRKIYAILIVITLGNVAAYSAYNPLVVYESINRYLAHSLFANAGILGIVFISTKKIFPIKALIILLGIGNIIASIVYQNHILNERSNPTKNFYMDLKSYVDKVEKSDVFYFDVANDSRGYFADAFSVASMPETTAIAWRYGVDRYDLHRVTEFSEMLNLLREKNIPINKVHSFFYANKKLHNTTSILRHRLSTDGTPKAIDFSLQKLGADMIITPNSPISSITPSKIYFDIKAKISSKISFPYISNPNLQKNPIAKDNNLRKLAFEYLAFKKDNLSATTVSTSSNWRNNVTANLSDNNQNTVWQSDRVIWGKKEPGIITIDSKKEIEIDRLVWINAYANNSPTHYKIDVSLDGKNWQQIKEIKTSSRIESWQKQIVSFQKTRAKFIKISFLKSLNNDSPGISEVWIVPSKFSRLDINAVEEFISQPFGFLPDQQSYSDTLKALANTEKVDISIKNDKNANWQQLESEDLEVKYDTKLNRHFIILPAGGQNVSVIKLSPKAPAEIAIENIFVEHPTLDEL